MSEKYTIEDCKNKAREKGGFCLSEVYINSSTKMLWKCSMEHIWSTTFNKICSGCWCIRCHKKELSKKLRLQNGLDIAIKIAASKNGICLSKTYINNRQKMDFVCDLGHFFQQPLNKLKDGGRWCQICSKIEKAKKQFLCDGLEQAMKLAKELGGICLSTEYNGAKSKLLFVCDEKHIFEVSLNNL